MNQLLEAHVRIAHEIASDLRHSAIVDGYTEEKAAFLMSIAHRIEVSALLGAAIRPGAAWLPIDQAPRDGTKVWLWIVMPAEDALLPNEDGTFGWGEPDVGHWNEALLQWEHSIAGNPTHFMHVVPPTAPLENTNVR